MERNYKKEWEKEKEKKTTRLVKIDKEIFEKLSKKLKEENKTFTGLVNDAILKYLYEDEKK